eukprot:6198765-Pleurochrysis_carterae.AAC.5
MMCWSFRTLFERQIARKSRDTLFLNLRISFSLDRLLPSCLPAATSGHACSLPILSCNLRHDRTADNHPYPCCQIIDDACIKLDATRFCASRLVQSFCSHQLGTNRRARTGAHPRTLKCTSIHRRQLTGMEGAPLVYAES